MGLTNEKQDHKKIPQKVSVIDFCSAPNEFNFQVLFPFNLKEWPMPVSQLLLGQIRSLEGGAHILEGRGCYLNKYWRGGVLSHQGGAPHSMWISHSSTQINHHMGQPAINGQVGQQAPITLLVILTATASCRKEAGLGFRLILITVAFRPIRSGLKLDFTYTTRSDHRGSGLQRHPSAHSCCTKLNLL